MKKTLKSGEDIISLTTTKKIIKKKIPKKVTKHKKYRKIEKGKTTKSFAKNVSLFTANAAGLKLKIPSLKSELLHLESGISTIQETHFRKKKDI